MSRMMSVAAQFQEQRRAAWIPAFLKGERKKKWLQLNIKHTHVQNSLKGPRTTALQSQWSLKPFEKETSSSTDSDKGNTICSHENKMLFKSWAGVWDCPAEVSSWLTFLKSILHKTRWPKPTSYTDDACQDLRSEKGSSTFLSSSPPQGNAS